MSEEGIFKGKRMHMWCCAGGTVVYYTSEIQHSFPFLAGCVSFGQKGGEGVHIFSSLAHFCARVLQLIGSFSSFFIFHFGLFHWWLAAAAPIDISFYSQSVFHLIVN